MMPTKPRPRRTVPLLALLVLVLPLAFGCGLFDDPGFIAYSVGEVGSRDVLVARPDGTERTVVAGSSSDDFNPVWSPDRTRVAFLSDRGGNIDIYIAQADGSSVMQVTKTGVDESQPTWSPDGDRMAYLSADENGSPHIFWVLLDDLIPNGLVFRSDGEIDPAWSPDGKFIAFSKVSNEPGPDGGLLPVGLFLRNPNGVNEFQLSQSPDSAPAWSPNGKMLAFVSTKDDDPSDDVIDSEIYVVTVGPDGPVGQPRRVTDNPARDFAPQWSPNGKRIVFISDRNGGRDIFTVNEEGEELDSLTLNDVEEIAVSWGPDGRIVFESQPTGKSDLFVMDVNGNQQLLSGGELPSSQPDW